GHDGCRRGAERSLPAWIPRARRQGRPHGASSRTLRHAAETTPADPQGVCRYRHRVLVRGGPPADLPDPRRPVGGETSRLDDEADAPADAGVARARDTGGRDRYLAHRLEDAPLDR